ncbi:Predicted metal-dependent hydrolase, TIM-barrel fold [Kaistia soli DSM 19436]|uniref:Predicted metal-dependent hydrolase, TIM-barrel fold n=1 Tax=Kaistia soli DSM 19436 TaxID=1122133 RepID=A0A1M5E160_9HYPH|nr:amidohydrolase family protein [Kaistia soli]SHF73008.1 Predicted metal-dependent hydrolase, TIM-barrel fold [Kaistia soli DSM 19436]
MADTEDAPLCLPPRPLRNPRGLRLPEGTCDSHLHVFSAGAPLASPRSYTPQMRGIEDWVAVAESFGIARGVLVQPSVYGLDNHVLLDALAAHPAQLRGVVVVDPAISDAELGTLDRAGVRGIRINLRNKAGIGLDAAAALAPRIRARGWHLQFQVGPDAIDSVAALAARHDIAAVIDHLAFMPLDDAPRPLATLQRALDDGRVHVKISAPYRLPGTAPDRYRSVVGALAASHPDCLLWGSDWPHTELFETVPEEDDLIALALDAVPAEAQRRVFVDNPALLYWTR